MKQKHVWSLLLIAAVLAAAWVFDLAHYLRLDWLQAQQAALQARVQAHPLPGALLFFALYAVSTALSFPGATILTLAGGAVFGLGWGVLIVSFASSVGAWLAFLAARFVLRDAVQARFADRLAAFNDGVAREGALYLFTLRLVPVFPFFLVNLLMGLTRMRGWTYYWVSQLGMLPATLVYVNAGTQLAQISSVQGIVSAPLLLSFALLGVFPLLAARAVAWFKRRRLYARWPRPARFDYNLVVIGAGSAGLVTAYIGAAVKARVALVERERMGGDCLNTGCVPSKALIRAAKLMAQMGRAEQFGLEPVVARADFAKVMQRVQRVVQAIAPHDAAERYSALGVECIRADAVITSPYTVEVALADGGRRILTTRSIVIAAGARPWVPPIPGLAEIGYLTSDTVWQLRALPPRLLVLGGGAIGCELAQAFARLGSQVTQVEIAPRLLAREDPEVGALVEAGLRADGVTVLTAHRARQFLLEDGSKVLLAEHDGSTVRICFDTVLCAVGRVANTAGYGLEQLGIPIAPAGTVHTDAYLHTLYPNIFAAGDVAGPFQLTHAAAHQAWHAAVNALFGRFRQFKVDYRVVPQAIFTGPEVARVGLNEQEALARNIRFEVTRYDLEESDRALADGVAHGFVKVLTVPGKDAILGATIVGEQAGELIAEFVLAMKHGLGLKKILGTIHIYPTLSEAGKAAAGNWARAHAPQRLLRWAERYHRWQRG